MTLHYCGERPVHFWLGKVSFGGELSKSHNIPKVQQSNAHDRTLEGPGAKFDIVKLC